MLKVVGLLQQAFAFGSKPSNALLDMSIDGERVGLKLQASDFLK